MRLGFYTDYSEQIAEFAQRTGFNSLELSAWPQSALNADTVDSDRLDAIAADLSSRDIVISALGYYPNYLAADRQEGEEAQRYFANVLALAERMGVDTVCTFVGQTPGVAVADCLPAFRDLFTGFCEEAEQRGVKIAIENCPMLDRRTRAGENIAYSPEIWEAMFEAVPSAALGIELDPSHCVYLGIDYVRAVLDFGDRIFHVHAKDTDIDEVARGRLGFFGQAFGELPGFGNGWWRFRAPGWGLVDWPRFISALVEVGYDGSLDIEHEDEVFAGAALAQIGGEADIVEMLGREPNGLRLGYEFLSRQIPSSLGEDLLPH